LGKFTVTDPARPPSYGFFTPPPRRPAWVDAGYRLNLHTWNYHENAMRYLLRIVELALLVLLVAITVQNSQSVEFRLFFGQAWNAPLIVYLLGFFVVGILLGLLATFSYYLRMRRELSHLKKELRQLHQSKVPSDPSDVLAD
jgi:putative membrane protein